MPNDAARVWTAFSQRRPAMKLRPMIMAVFLMGYFFGSLWGFNSSFTRLSFYLTNPTSLDKTRNASVVEETATTHHSPVTGETKNDHEEVVVETKSDHKNVEEESATTHHSLVTEEAKSEHEDVVEETKSEHEDVVEETAATHHSPDTEQAKSEHDDVKGGRFSVSLERTLSERGLHIMTPLFGCHFAAWVFYGGGTTEDVVDCTAVSGDVLELSEYHVSQRLNAETAKQIQAFDTIFVNYQGFEEFIQTILPKIVTPIVLIAGQYRYIIGELLLETQSALLNSPHIVRVFAHNLGIHFPQQPNHPKLASYALGMAPIPEAMELFTETFYKVQNDPNHKKVKGIMHGYISNTNPKRDSVPSGPPLNFTEYYDEIALHRFILSPDGARPECYRDYEAIGLGTIPITELPTDLYRHLQSAPVLYETTDWKLNEAQALERLGVTDFPTVNRMMITEEFWLDYIQREMGENELRWFDRLSLRKAKLADFKILT